MDSIQKLAETFIKTKNERDFSALYERIRPGLLIHAKNFLAGDENAAEDVVSDALIKAYLKIHQYNPHWNFSTWVYRIVKNEAMQYIRKNGNIYSLDALGGDAMAEKILVADIGIIDNGISEGATEPNWFIDEEPMTQESLYEMATEQIHQLPQLYKDIMIDREINRMKYEDISEKYGLEINTVKTRISRARQKICKTVMTEAFES